MSTPRLFGYDVTRDIPSLADMPLLAEFVDKRTAGQPLRDTTAIFIQHQLGNQVPMTEAMIELGLRPEDIYWLDIPYTASSWVRNRLITDSGIPESNFRINRYRLLDPYAPYQRQRAQELVRDIVALDPHRILVLDDGAYFLEAASGFRDRPHPVAVVEQTTRGFIKIRKNRTLAAYAEQIPIVDVAGSVPKMTLEPPWIGMAVVASLEHHLGLLPTEFVPQDGAPALILGYGAIGQAVAASLSDRMSIHVFDPEAERREEAQRHGHAVWDPDDSPMRFQLVVGCSGTASFEIGDQVFLDRHAVLVSASSGSVELSRRGFIELAASSEIDDISIDHQRLHSGMIHSPLFMELVDRQVVFLNGGFPINFDGRVNCVPTLLIQPTAMMMVQGALQAVASSDVGRVELDEDFCRDLDARFRASLSPEELSALEPSHQR